MTTAPRQRLRLGPYTRAHMRAVQDLVFRSACLHTHLDWQPLEDWLRATPGRVLLAWDAQDTLVGALGVSTPLDEACWVRLAVVAASHQPAHTLALLWQGARQHDLLPRLVGALVIRPWLGYALAPLGFAYREDVVTLRRVVGPLVVPHTRAPHLRTFTPDDVPVVAALDQAAFAPLWQLTTDDLAHALRMGRYSTVAVQDGMIVGYQITTSHGNSSHLARLAVLPAAQGGGVGGWLLHDMLAITQRRGQATTTVNTQATNIRSQRLYERYGFQRNGFDLPTYQCHPHAADHSEEPPTP